MYILKKLFLILTPGERTHAGFLMAMIMVMAVLDILGVASILPFIAVLANPELVQTNSMLNTAFTYSQHIGIQNTKQFLFALGLFVFAMIVISLTFKAFTTYAQTRFALMREYTISKRLVQGYLHQPYSWFLNRNSADLGKSILSEVEAIISNGMIPLMTFMAQSAVALAVMILLIFIDPMLALYAGFLLTLSYVVIFLIIKGWLMRLGQARTQANQERFTVINEAFGAVKEVKVGGLEQLYLERFANSAKIYAKSQAAAQVIAKLPRFALEAIAFGGMLLITLYLMSKSSDFGDVIPIVSLYAFAGYRLLPALQQVYGALSQIRFIGPALDYVCKDLNSLKLTDLYHDDIVPMQLTKSIRLSQVSFKFPGTTYNTLKGIDLTIPANVTVGFVGPTGSGKTSTVDVLLGLLVPQKGSLIVDDQTITNENRRCWQSTVGYVPQHVYLSDESVAANIAFGLPANEINQKAIESAAKIANLHEFVTSELPQGYATIVGERGVRLSGGQRQRIGIARALYNNPQVLVLDEATSALDNLTEHSVMKALYNLGHKITIILIAHRLSTVRGCDQIHLIENGELKGSGTYEQLIVSNPQFSALAGAK